MTNLLILREEDKGVEIGLQSFIKARSRSSKTYLDWVKNKPSFCVDRVENKPSFLCITSILNNNVNHPDHLPKI